MLLALFYRILNSQEKRFLDRTKYPEGLPEADSVSLKVGRDAHRHIEGERETA